MNAKELDRLSEGIIGAAIDVHKVLGPGLLESAYETCLAYELAERGLGVERQTALPITYKGIRLDAGYRLDLWIQRSVVVEVKAIDSLEPIHSAQLLSYLRLSGCSLGLLINFNVKLLKRGIRRVVHNFPDQG